jgi:hypothetical protein
MEPYINYRMCGALLHSPLRLQSVVLKHTDKLNLPLIYEYSFYESFHPKTKLTEFIRKEHIRTNMVLSNIKVYIKTEKF